MLLNSFAVSRCFSQSVRSLSEKTNNLVLRPGPTQTGLYSHRSRLEAWNFGLKKKRDCSICAAKTKTDTLCSYCTTELHLCFTYACCWVSYAVAHITTNSTSTSLQHFDIALVLNITQTILGLQMVFLDKFGNISIHFTLVRTD